MLAVSWGPLLQAQSSSDVRDRESFQMGIIVQCAIRLYGQ